jgi:NO-binding membrane sensor protein with MHYT domain
VKPAEHVNTSVELYACDAACAAVLALAIAAPAFAGVDTALLRPSHVTAEQLSDVVKEPDWAHVYVTVLVKPAEHVNTSVEPYACDAACAAVLALAIAAPAFAGVDTALLRPSHVTAVHPDSTTGPVPCLTCRAHPEAT